MLKYYKHVTEGIIFCDVKKDKSWKNTKDLEKLEDGTLADYYIGKNIDWDKHNNQLAKSKTEYINLYIKELNDKSYIAISDSTITPEILLEYKAKREAIINNDISYFIEEAELLSISDNSITAAHIFNKAKVLSATWVEQVKEYRKLLGSIRITLKLFSLSDIIKLRPFIDSILFSTSSNKSTELKSLLGANFGNY